jgi:thiol-disulfide isomerase/thioredoxin
MRILTWVLFGAAIGLAQAPPETVKQAPAKQAPAKQVPRRPPPFSLLLPDAAPLPLSHYRGKVVALTFISEVCSHCQALTLQLNPLAHEFAPRGVQFLECAINDGAAEGLKEFTMKFQPAFPVGWATREAMMSYLGISPMDLNATFVPRMLFLDRLGAIRDNFEPGTEFYSNPPVNIRAELEKLLKR